MNQILLESLKRCYAQSREPVLLLDEKWQVVWQNLPLEPGYLPALAGIAADSWQPCDKTVKLGDRCLALHLLGSQEDGIRIAAFSPEPLATLPMETDVISNAVHSLHAACRELYRVLDENDLYEEMDILAAVSGNCLRLYRPAFIQKELERMQSGIWRKDTFSARQQLIAIHEKIRRVLGRCADLELDFCTEPVSLTGDMDAFAAAILSALAICFHDREHRLEITIRLERQDNFCTVTVTMTPTPETRDDQQQMVGNFGSTYGEQILLDAFCRQTGGHWMQGTSDMSHFCRITLPCSDAFGGTFRSPSEAMEQGLFSRYEILLGRIHHFKTP